MEIPEFGTNQGHICREGSKICGSVVVTGWVDFIFFQMCLCLWGRGEGGFPRSGSITVFGLELREYSAFLPFHCTSLFLRFVYYGLIWGKWSVCS